MGLGEIDNKEVFRVADSREQFRREEAFLAVESKSTGREIPLNDAKVTELGDIAVIQQNILQFEVLMSNSISIVHEIQSIQAGVKDSLNKFNVNSFVRSHEVK